MTQVTLPGLNSLILISTWFISNGGVTIYKDYVSPMQTLPPISGLARALAKHLMEYDSQF